MILNNNGIGGGVRRVRPRQRTGFGVRPARRYEKLVEAFGGRGFFVTKPDELGAALKEALASPAPTIVNVMLNPRADRKAAEFALAHALIARVLAFRSPTEENSR